MRITGTKVGPGCYTYAAGRFMVRRRQTRIPVSGGEIRLSWEVLDARGGGKGVGSKGGAVNWIIRRLADERLAELDRVDDDPQASPVASDQPAAPSRQCSNCVHFRDELEEVDDREDLEADSVFACAAFPQGIPAAILEERHDHRKAFKGDQGIRFDPEGERALEVVASIAFGRSE